MIQADGTDAAEVFRSLLAGMFTAAGPRGLGKKPTERWFDVDGDDLPNLLVNFLNEAIGMSDSRHEVYEHVRFDDLTDHKARN